MTVSDAVIDEDGAFEFDDIIVIEGFSSVFHASVNHLR